MIGDQRMVADVLADAFLVQRVVVDRADQAVGSCGRSPGRPGWRRPGTARHDAPPCGCCGRTAPGRPRRSAPAARSCSTWTCRSARNRFVSAPKICAASFCAASAGPSCVSRSPSSSTELSRSSRNTASPRCCHEDPADRAACIEDAAIMAGAGPKLVALLGIIHQRAEERRFQRLGVVPQMADQVAADEIGRFLGQEHIAVDLVQHLDRNLLQPLTAHQHEDRQFQAARRAPVRSAQRSCPVRRACPNRSPCSRSPHRRGWRVRLPRHAAREAPRSPAFPPTPRSPASARLRALPRTARACRTGI